MNSVMLRSAKRGPLFHIIERTMAEKLKKEKKTRQVLLAAEVVKLSQHEQTAKETKDNFKIELSCVKTKPTVNEIINFVAASTDIPRQEIIDLRRTKNVIGARHLVYWLCRETTGLSLPRIGQLLQGRDHTTILHGCNKINRHIIEDTHLGKLAVKLRERINSTQSNVYWGC